MIVQINLGTNEPIYDDYFFQLGWLSINCNNSNFELFKDGMCMIFPTISSLIDFLASRNNKLYWIGEDSGKVYKVLKKRNILTFQKDKEQVSLSCDKVDFILELDLAIKKVMKDLEIKDSTIDVNQDFIYLLEQIKTVKQTV